MADKQVGALSAAASLDGSELVHVVQGGNSRKATTGALSTLALEDVAELRESVRISSGEEGVALADYRGLVALRATGEELHHRQIYRMETDIASLLAVSDDQGVSAAGAAKRPFLAQDNHVLVYGQSLSVGSHGTPVRSTTAVPYAKRFTYGVSTQAVTNPATELGSMVNLNEITYETVSSSIFRMVAQLLDEEDGIDIADLATMFLVSAPGEGSRHVLQMSERYPSFIRAMRDVTYAKAISDAVPRSFRVPLVVWIQGEDDTDILTTQRDYFDMLRANINQMRASLAAITGDADGPRWLSYQTATNLHYSNPVPSVALAQLEMERLGYLELVHPSYQLDFDLPNDQHLLAPGYQKLGADIGVTVKRMFFDGVRRTGLRVVKSQAFGKYAQLRLSAIGGVEFDTTTFSDFGDYGFDILDGAGSAMDIQAIELIDENTIQFRLDALGAASWRYGWRARPGGNTGVSGGNVRDRQGDTIILTAQNGASADNHFPIHNWLPICAGDFT